MSKTDVKKHEGITINLKMPKVFKKAAAAVRKIPSLWEKRIPKKAQNIIVLVAVLGLSFLTYFKGYDKPDKLFWDESYHVQGVERYIHSVAQFEAHPPLGKFFMVISEEAMGLNKGKDVQKMLGEKIIQGDSYPYNFTLRGMRLAPALFATFSVLFFFGIIFALSKSKFLSVVFSSFYLFETCLIVHLRGVHLDAFQVFFALGALWYFIVLWQRVGKLKIRNYVGLSAFITCSFMVKINAAFLYVLLPMLYFKEAGFHFKTKAFWLDGLKKALSALAVAFVIAYGVFYIHVLMGQKLPDEKTWAGREDIAHMSYDTYDAYVRGDTKNPKFVLGVMKDYFYFMHSHHTGIPVFRPFAEGDNGSHPLLWPLNYRKIPYRWEFSAQGTNMLMLFGNPGSYGIAFFVIIGCAVLILAHRLFKLPLADKKSYGWIEIIFGLYLSSMLLMSWMAANRVIYLYHYFIPLLMSYILVFLMWQYITKLYPSKYVRWGLLAVIVGVVLWGFWYAYDFTHYVPMWQYKCQEVSDRMWLGQLPCP